jgi:hypothetical protein
MKSISTRKSLNMTSSLKERLSPDRHVVFKSQLNCARSVAAVGELVAQIAAVRMVILRTATEVRAANGEAVGTWFERIRNERYAEDVFD